MEKKIEIAYQVCFLTQVPALGSGPIRVWVKKILNYKKKKYLTTLEQRDAWNYTDQKYASRVAEFFNGQVRQ